jgi:hypothetical protein
VDRSTSVEFQVVAVVLDEHSVMTMEVDAVTKVFVNNYENGWCDKPSKLLWNSCLSCSVGCVFK